MRRNSPCWNGIGRGKSHDAVIEDSLALLRLAAEVTEAKASWATAMPVRSACRGRPADGGAGFHPSCRHRSAGDPDGEGEGDADALRSRARRGGVDVGDDDDWSDMFAKILTLRVEPRLGLDRLLYSL